MQNKIAKIHWNEQDELTRRSVEHYNEKNIQTSMQHLSEASDVRNNELYKVFEMAVREAVVAQRDVKQYITEMISDVIPDESVKKETLDYLEKFMEIF